MRRARPDKLHVSWPGLLCQAMWRGGMVTARIATLVLFAVGFHAWLFLLVGLHWLGMTVWIMFQQTDFCPTPWEECIYNCVVGVIYCFSFFNLQEGQSRRRAFTFYIIIVSQNVGCLFLFLTLAGATKSGLVEVATAMIIGGTVLGLTSMLLYYRFFHPAGPIQLCVKPLQHNVECGTTDQTATMRSLKHCTINRANGNSPQEEPHSDDICMDKKLLLTHCVVSPQENEETSFEAANKQKRRGICLPLELGLEEMSEENQQKHQRIQSLDPSSNVEEIIDEEKKKCRGICSLDPELGLEERSEEEKQKRRAICPLDSGLNLDDNTEEEKQKCRGLCLLDSKIELDKKEQIHLSNCKLEERREADKQKRRGICSLDAELDLVEEKEILHGIIIQSVEDRTDVDKQKRRGICSLEPGMEVELELGIRLDVNEEKTDNSSESVVEGKQADEETPSEVLSVPSEVLSAHDYENMCAVNIAREAWGLRSWRAYSDIETWLHDDSVVRDRRRDTLTSTTSASSEHSGGMSSPPPIPCRRPTRTPRTRQDDYLDTLVDDLACCEFVLEEPDSSVFVAKPYVVDQHGALFPLGTLDTIMEELEESSTSTDPRHGSASTLVATIDEIRHGDMWEAQNDPPQCRVPLSPEEILFLSKLQPTSEPSPEVILDAAPYLETISDNPAPRKRPRRKFSLLREKFETKNAVMKSTETTRPAIDNSRLNIEERIKQWNNILNSYNSEQDSHSVKSGVRDRKNMFLKQVLSPSWGKKRPHGSSVKVVSAT
ncbi:hypothetical protein L9F63_001921 [Diploptera punctata]|uniref:XK-related protein n=1 Tax=Diploptera punctata TaxID=6984 RepID=A0AAD8EJ90_DIPPU|nr:hypothetical protein L9F63_001921 [Diploptera punctata]